MAQIKDKDKLGGESGRLDARGGSDPGGVARIKQPSPGKVQPVASDDTKDRMRDILANRRAGRPPKAVIVTGTSAPSG